MNPDAQFQRAALLFDQQRHELAAAALRQVLAVRPEHAAAHAMLALCLARREQFDDAQRSAEQAVQLAPDDAFTHYALASVLQDRHDLPAATVAAREAVRLAPADADYHALVAQLLYQERNWTGALAAVDTALQFEPEHVSANNLRTMALTQLGRRAEAGATVDATLARVPEDPWAHANKGWTLLHGGERKPALEHFKEALRLDPDNEHARTGLLEALKAGNPGYALMLRYFLWMQRLSSRAQWGVILGGYFGSRILSAIARSNPDLQPWVLPLQMAYLGFVLLTWLAQPLGNLLLRLNRFGRLVLTAEETFAANLVGLCLLASLLLVGLGAATNFTPRFLIPAVVCFALSLPVAGVFKVATGWPRRVMYGFAGVLTVAAALVVILVAGLDARLRSGEEAVDLLGLASLSVFGLGILASPWVVNGLSLVRPRR